MHTTFARLTTWASAWSGSPAALAVSVGVPAVTLAWAIVGHWLDLWLIIAGAVTGIVSIVLLVLLQSAQSKDTASILAMLAELVHATDKASDRVIPADDA